MPFDIKFEHVPAGCADASVAKGGEVKLISSEFTSSEDGERFITRLEGLPSLILNHLVPENRIPFSCVHTMLAIIRKDCTATVYLNQELGIQLKVRPKVDVEKGQPVYEDDYTSIDELSFEGVTIPDDAGYVFINSKGWRKSLLFDLNPLSGEPRTYNLNKVLGHYCAYLWFQHIFKIESIQWERLFAGQWFPFVTLNQETNKRLLAFAKDDVSLDEMTEAINAEMAPKLNGMLDKWRTRKTFAPHIVVLEKAVERHLAEDYISSTGLLFPRIEGLMRSHFAVAHGIAPTGLYTLKTSLIGLLIVDQLFYLMQIPTNNQKKDSA